MRIAGLLALLLLVLWLVGRFALDGPSPSPTAAQSGGDGIDPPASAADARRLEGRSTGDSGAALAASSDVELPAWPVGEPDSDDVGTGRVFVRLVDHAGQPLAHHPIEVDWWRAFGVSGEMSGRTDEHGRFRTDARAAWEIDSVGVPLAGGRNETGLYHAGPFAARPSSPNEIAVEVPASAQIRVRVVDADGKPIVTTVACESRPSLSLDPFLFRMRINERTFKTDAEGHIVVPVVAGHYLLWTKRGLPGTANARVTLSTRQRIADVTLVVASPARETGRTVDGDVRTMPADMARRERTIRVVGRLPDGRTIRPMIAVMRGEPIYGTGGFSASPYDGVEGEPVNLVGDEAVHVVLTYMGMAYAGVGPLLVANAPDRVEVPLEAEGTALVRLVDASGRPVPCTIELHPMWRFFRTSGDGATTDPGTREGAAPFAFDVHRAITEDGEKTFSGLGSVPYQVLARPANPGLRPSRGEIRAGQTVELVPGQGLEHRVDLSGRVTDASSGAPIPDARVAGSTDEGSGDSDHVETTTNADGRFQLSGLPPAPTTLFVAAHGYAFIQIPPIDLRTAERVIELRLIPARRLPLHVVDRTGTPVRNALIKVRDAGGNWIELQDQYGNRDGDVASTDRAGRVDLLGLPAAHLIVEVDVGGDTPATEYQLDLHRPPEELVTLTLDP